MTMTYWTGQPPATDGDIEKLLHVVRFDLPPEYIALLRRHNGGQGPLGIEPLWLQLWSVDEVIEFARLKLDAWRFPGHLFFGANGAGERIAMRRSAHGALEIVTVDPAAGLDSARVVATDFTSFIAAIGK